MSDQASVTTLPVVQYPCEKCGAGANQPCDPDCPYSEYDPAFADEAQAGLFELPSEAKLRRALMAICSRLPLSGLAGEVPDPEYMPEHEWLARMTVWMQAYHDHAAQAAEEMIVAKRKAISMQIERDTVDAMIRRALGGPDGV